MSVILRFCQLSTAMNKNREGLSSLQLQHAVKFVYFYSPDYDEIELLNFLFAKLFCDDSDATKSTKQH